MRGASSPEARGDRQALLDARDAHLERLGSRWNTSIIEGAVGLEGVYLDLARAAFLEDGDIDGFFHQCALAAAARARLLACVARGMACPEERLRSTDLRALYAAIASGERKVTLKLATRPLLPSAREAAGLPKHELAFAYALRLLAAGERPAAAAPARAFARSLPGADDGRAAILAGLCASNEARFNEGLHAFIEALPRRPGEAGLSIEALAFARLGKGAGLAVTVHDPAIGPELLGEAEAPYPDPAAVFPKIADEILDVSERERL
jgi:hypothetical protein